MKILTPLIMVLFLSACGMTPIKDTQTTQLDNTNIEYAYTKKSEPTTILISGFGVPMEIWEPVYSKLSQTHSVFVYNRFGYGKSGERSEKQNAKTIVEHLRNLLKEKDIKPPYILVGHSIGGLYANFYARSYPDEVTGIVYVDSSHPEQVYRADEFEVSQGITGYLLQPIFALSRKLNTTMFTEIDSFEESSDQTLKAGTFPNIPVIALTAEETASHKQLGGMWQTLQWDLTNKTKQGKQILVKGTSHSKFMIDNPEIIIKSIKEIAQHSN